jgi:membrane-associated phospholipid phosphatase
MMEFAMNMKRNIAIFLLVALLIAFSNCFLDEHIARFVKETVISGERLGMLSANIPDLLLPLVCIIGATAWTAYFTRVHKGIYNVHTRFFLLVANTVPLAFILKSILKQFIGRINTRFWLLHPEFEQFQWFHGQENYSGFPSGHMAVFTALIIALWVHYPRFRSVYVVFLLLLALSLIATDYHFLSDVIAGAYLALIVHTGTSHVLSLLNNPQRGA